MASAWHIADGVHEVMRNQPYNWWVWSKFFSHGTRTIPENFETIFCFESFWVMISYPYEL
jgi:hypothetical protein